MNSKLTILRLEIFSAFPSHSGTMEGYLLCFFAIRFLNSYKTDTLGGER